MMRTLTLAVLALALWGCSENPLDPSRLGKLKTAVGEVDTINGTVGNGEPNDPNANDTSTACGTLCNAIGECVGWGIYYDSFNACNTDCLTLTPDAQRQYADRVVSNGQVDCGGVEAILRAGAG